MSSPFSSRDDCRVAEPDLGYTLLTYYEGRGVTLDSGSSCSAHLDFLATLELDALILTLFPKFITSHLRK